MAGPTSYIRLPCVLWCNKLIRLSTGQIWCSAMAEAAEESVSKKQKLEESSDDEEKQPVLKRVARKKCILLLSYCGKGYMGMQRNPGVPTIEEDLAQALWKAGAIPEVHRDNFNKLGFQRCARTDKGVSAARQVVSLKMVPETSIIDTINQHLPEQIRVMGLKKVVRGFDSKKACTSRLYEYLMPTYAFAPFKQTNLAYRISADTLSRIQALLNLYLGTHNFHNFTSGRKHDDPSSNRYIMSFSIGQPFLRNDLEFVALKIEGQSFMLHQIRKMIGLVIAIVRDYVADDCIIQAFHPPKLDIPRAPAIGLFLDEVRYLNYNRKYGEDGMHEKLDWTEYEDAVISFKERFIYGHIINTELREHIMLQWLQTLQLHDFYQRRRGPQNLIETSNGLETQTDATAEPETQTDTTAEPETQTDTTAEPETQTEICSEPETSTGVGSESQVQTSGPESQTDIDSNIIS